MKLYRYTLLKQDGTIQDLGVSAKKDFKEIYKILDCDIIELIPSDYYKGKGHGRCNMYGDEEGRFKSTNHRNPHFNVLQDTLLGTGEWDVVGNIVKEEVAKPTAYEPNDGLHSVVKVNGQNHVVASDEHVSPLDSEAAKRVKWI